MAYLALDDAEADAIHDAAAADLPGDTFGLITEVFPDGSEGAKQLSLQIDADTHAGANATASAQWAKLRARAGLRDSRLHIDFLVGPVDQATLFYRILLLRAGNLSAREPSYAIVAAQTALEVYVRGLLGSLLRNAASTEVADVVLSRSQAMTLRDPHSSRLLAALSGSKPSQQGEIWQRYVEHVKRRNGVVHEGADFDQEAAVESIRAVEGLIDWIDTDVMTRQ